MSVSVETQLLIIVEGGVVVDVFTGIDETETLVKFHELTNDAYRGDPDPYAGYWHDDEKDPDNDIYWFVQTHLLHGSTLLHSVTTLRDITLPVSEISETEETVEEEFLQ